MTHAGADERSHPKRVTGITDTQRNYHGAVDLSSPNAPEESAILKIDDVTYSLMQAQASFPPFTLDQIVEQIITSHKITRNDQRLLMSMFSNAPLGSREESLINRVHEALRKGLLRVVD